MRGRRLTESMSELRRVLEGGEGCEEASLVVQWLNNSPANAGDMGSVPGLGRSSGEGNGNPLQDARLGNPMDRGD